MNAAFRRLSTVWVSLAAVACWASWLEKAGAASPAANICDLALQPDGTFRGVVVDVDGVPIADTTITVRQIDRNTAQAMTDASGCFYIAGLAEGRYQVIVGRYVRDFRVWTAHTAPPGARPFAMIVVGGDAVRGQRALGKAISMDTVVIVGLIGAMASVPIVASQRSPASP